jgi:phosphate:Na+ symporter
MISLIGQIIGGVGLFLIGTELLRKGFEDSAGNSLRRILADFTDKTPKGLVAGFIVSSAVQSATAVIFTLIGFVNAQLLQLRQAVDVVFGANLGKITIVLFLTTFGFKFNLTSYALPVLGAGAFLKIFLKGKRAGLATALMGFGLIFLGIDTLKTSITLINHEIDLRHLNLEGQNGLAIYLLAGMVTTFVTQSSTSAIVITISALASGIFTLENAMALVIGENFGTVSSALMASLGSTPAAKRLTAAHITYNSVCTLIGLFILESVLLSGRIDWVVSLAGGDTSLAFTYFYCAYILFALAATLPFRERIVRELERRFHDTKSLGSPRFIDHGKALHPATAIEALHNEVLRFGRIASGMLDVALQWNMKKGWVYTVDLSHEERELDRLSEYIHWFASRTARKQGSVEVVRAVQALSMASRHFETVSDLSKKISRLKGKLTEPLLDNASFDALREWTERLRQLLLCLDEPLVTGDLAEIKTLDAEFIALEEKKSALRQRLLDAGVSQEMTNSQTIVLNDLIDTCRRAMRDQLRGITETWSAQKPANGPAADSAAGGIAYSIK